MVAKRQLFFLKQGKRASKNFFLRFSINKRQKFVVSIIILSFGLFFSQHFLGKSGVFFTVILSFLTVVLLLASNYKDLMENFSFHFFVLPFFYSLAFGLFYFLVPARFLTRMLMTSLYAVGLYSLFLSQNIFAVASMRTIALLSSARTVSFIITLISYFFLTNVLYALDLSSFLTAGILFGYTFFLSSQSIWTYTLEKSYKANLYWFLGLSLCLFETALFLWFWPSSPTFIALFLTGLFYITVGLSHVWFDKRLFRSVLWEYIWVAAIVSCILFVFTSWKA